MKTFLEYMSIKGDANVHVDEDGNLFDINDSWFSSTDSGESINVLLVTGFLNSSPVLKY